MSGKYKGAHVANITIPNNLEPYIDISTTRYDPVYNLMLRIKNRKDYQYPVVKYTNGINDNQSTTGDEPVIELPFYIFRSTVATMGGSS